MFRLKAEFEAAGDQPEAIAKLTAGLEAGMKHQVLLGVTGSGKTFTIANVIQRVQKPTLVISPNKTLAGQLYQEFREFFPENAVSYFVSYYDYYQPEAYVPQTDTYIEKETAINETIDKLRLEATTQLMTRSDVIVVASVSCIYNLGSPAAYRDAVLTLEKGTSISRREVLRKLTSLHYQRRDYDFGRGSFRVRGQVIDVYPAYADTGVRIVLDEEKVASVHRLDPVTGSVLEDLDRLTLYPAKHYLADAARFESVQAEIRQDLKERLEMLKKEGKELEARRLKQRTEYDLQMMAEIGYVNGIENYSRYLDGRAPGEPPSSLIDFFPPDFLLVIDESHLTVPQIRGMYRGDRARKQTLIDHGFRLPSALDNRPLRFGEFLSRINQAIYTSATPGEWEIRRAKKSASLVKGRQHPGVVEQLVRPTGLLDPAITIRPTKNQVADLVEEIGGRVAKGERTLVTTLTKRGAEDLADYLQKQGFKTHYLHSEIDTLDRADVLDNLRRGVFEVAVGINLLREGLDLPEVSLVAILDADKEGFLRSETSLIQTMGRASRHLQGRVILYADDLTGSIKRAVAEVERRRRVQAEYNLRHKISPRSISKPIRKKIVSRPPQKRSPRGLSLATLKHLQTLDAYQLTPSDRRSLLKRLRTTMKQAAADLDFEAAALLRDKAKEVEKSIYG
jgi:excinuclease ABC subunit B